MAKRNFKTDCTLTLTRAAYRTFADQTKAVGLALNISSYKRMDKCWGGYSPWALLVCKDATDPNTKFEEQALITLSSSINTAKLRAAGPSRPELDWSTLNDDEIYPFVVQHEIGHRVDNFDQLGIMMIKDIPLRDECHRRVRFVNEVLADRYAWNQIRPGEPVPLSTKGKTMQEKTAESLAFMRKHAPIMGPAKHPLKAGPYLDVPEYMLATTRRAAFLGPRVSMDLLGERIAYHAARNSEGRRPLY